MTTFRFRGLRKDGVIIESNDIEDSRFQDFLWFEETSTIPPEMWEMLKLRSELPPFVSQK